MAQYFNLTLDTTAPQNGILSGLSAYYNANATVTISADGASFMKVWTNQNAVGTTDDASFPSSWEPYNTSKQVSFSGQGTQYVHAQFMDNVGNIGPVVNSDSTIYDTVNPVISAVSINSGDSYTNHAANNVIRVTVTDATSGVQKLSLSGPSTPTGDITFTADDRTAGYKDIAITLTGADGTKTIQVTATDFAGNTCAASSDSITLDTTPAEGTLILRNAADTANLPSFVNSYDYAAAIESTDTDIVQYKLWEGATEPSEWTAAHMSAGRQVDTGLEFSTGEGQKTVYAKIKDISGNVTDLTPVMIEVDTTAPVVTLSASPTVISEKSGHNQVTFTCTATDTNSAQGMSYELKLGDDVIKSGAFSSSVVVTEAEIVAISAGQGVKSFTLEVTDVAGNTGTSSAQTVTVDLTAPTGSVIVPTYSTSTTFNATVAGTDTGGATLSNMKVYLDDQAPSTWESFVAGSYSLTTTEGAHYVHLQLKDSVDNASAVYDSSKIIVDTTAPTGSLSGATYTKTTAYTVTVTSSDAKQGVDEVSGVAQMKVWENGTTEPSWETIAASKSLTLTSTDGQKTINLKLKDNAGNESSVFTHTVYLDQSEPAPSIVLYDSTNTSVLPAKVNVLGYSIRIASTDPDYASPATYHFASSVTGDGLPADGTLTYDAGKQYQSFTGLTLAQVEGLHTITVTLTDAAGNVGTASAEVTYDETPPEITVNAPDYNRISKVHSLRKSSDASDISGKYCDMITFTWHASEFLAEYKVCVNEAEQTAAGAVAIGTTGGSQNMSGTDIDGSTNVTSVIMGADFAATSAVDDTDGVYEIIVYGKDASGTWSAVHALSSQQS